MEGILVVGKLQEIEMIAAKGEMKACAMYKILTTSDKGRVDLVKIKDTAMALKAKVGEIISLPVKFGAYINRSGQAALSCSCD